jgi:hypothetical protein
MVFPPPNDWNAGSIYGQAASRWGRRISAKRQRKTAARNGSANGSAAWLDGTGQTTYFVTDFDAPPREVSQRYR